MGRFAPSPTGPLHFGSLIAAVTSYLCAKSNQGHWLLRIEDIDTQREQKGAAQSIIQTLEDYGFEWNGDIRYQSHHLDDYENALEQLSSHTFPCSCSRKDLQQAASTGKFSYIYPGFCRDQLSHADAIQTSIRVRSDYSCGSQINFKETCQKTAYKQNIEKDVGDFILKRSDGLFAYQLAVVVDDELQGVTHIVRGADLFDNTPRQRYLQCLLNYKEAEYFHFPVAIKPDGKKLSKQNLSPEISVARKRSTLINVLEFLGQQPPSSDNFSSMDDIWSWAVQNWKPYNIDKTLTKSCPSLYE